MKMPFSERCDSSDGRGVTSYPPDPGSNPAVSGSMVNTYRYISQHIH